MCFIHLSSGNRWIINIYRFIENLNYIYKRYKSDGSLYIIYVELTFFIRLDNANLISVTVGVLFAGVTGSASIIW